MPRRIPGPGLRSQLGAAVERNRRRGGESGTNAARGNARGQRRGASRLEGIAAWLERQGGKRGDRVDAAAAQQDEAGFVPPCSIRARSPGWQIVLEQLAAADAPCTPASTLGLAAASMTQSAAGSVSRSLAVRMSPWMKFTPSVRNRRRLVSEPGRIRLSIPQIERPRGAPAGIRQGHCPRIRRRR